MHLVRLSLVLSVILTAQAFGLDNPSFESHGSISPWRPISDMQGGKGSMQVVQDVHHEGDRSLMLTAQNGAEAVVAQTVTLPANSLWRARCWIRTKDLEEPVPKGAAAAALEDATCGANLQIRDMHDKVIAETESLTGTAGWQEVETVFRAPAGGQFLVGVVVEGPTQRAGRAWFDDVQLDRLEDARLEQHVLNFPIQWIRPGPYDKLLPKDPNGNPGPWYCHQMAPVQIVRYWSMKAKLRCSGTFWYLRRDNKELISADYNVPFRWDLMVPSLTGMPYTDPHVDPLADFVFRFTAAQRSQWPAVTGGHPYYWTLHVREAFIKYFGFDATSMRYIHFGEFLKTHSWNDLYDIIRKEIDDGRPILMALTGSKPGNHAHSVVLTGYRKVADRTEFTFNWNRHGGYNPSQTFRLDKPIRDFDTPTNHNMFVGIKPDTTHEQLPLYNKVAEQWDSDYDAWTASALIWNRDRREYAAVYPGGAKTAQRFYFQRISEGGLPVGRSFPISLRGSCRKPVLAWSGVVYGLAWEDRTDKIGTVWFIRISPEDGRLRDNQAVRLGEGAADSWRPCVSLVHNGTEFAVAWEEKGQLKFQRISSAGAPQLSSRKTIAAGIDPHLVWLGDSYVLAFSAEGAICLVRLSEDGTIQGEIQKIFAQPSRGVWTPRVCWSGSQFGVTWEFVSRDWLHHICFARADDQCKLIKDSVVMVSDFDAPTRTALNPAISWHKDGFVLTYRKDDAYLTRLTDQGKVIENRYLFGAPNWVTHATQGDTACVLYLHAYGEERSVEVESCLFPLGEGG